MKNILTCLWYFCFLWVTMKGTILRTNPLKKYSVVRIMKNFFQYLSLRHFQCLKFFPFWWGFYWWKIGQQQYFYLPALCKIFTFKKVLNLDLAVKRFLFGSGKDFNDFRFYHSYFSQCCTYPVNDQMDHKTINQEINHWGAFKNYVDQFLPYFDHLPTSGWHVC